MKLLTKEVLAQFKKTGRQETIADPIVIANFFNPAGAGTWYATEFDETDKIFFGFVSIHGDWCDEWGSFALSDLESFRGRFGLKIERDIFFEAKPFSTITL